MEQNTLNSVLLTASMWRALTNKCVSQVNGLWGESCVESSPTRWDYCWLTDEGLDSIGYFFFFLGVGDG